MKISVDGGALCSPSNKRFGNFTFSQNLIRALSLYDKKNNYCVYTFCNKPNDLILTNNTSFKVLLPKFLWMNMRVSFEELFSPKNIYLALNQAMPLATRSRVIGFTHGLSFIKYPEYYRYSYLQLKTQLDRIIKRSEHIIASSTRVKEDLLEVNPVLESKIVVLPFGIPFDFKEYERKQKQSYFLFVGMNQPIKNVKFILESFQKFIEQKEYSRFGLYLIGPFTNLIKKYKRVFIHQHLPREKLRSLYRKATGYLTASHYESFNFPVLEALSQKCPVVGLKQAIVPEMENYCEVANDQDEFITKMQEVASGKNHLPTLEMLHKVFSWEKYVKDLAKLYD